MPTSADRIAIKSLAPSPHIPTFVLSYPHNLEINDLFMYSAYIAYLNFTTTSALFSGEIRAKSFMLVVICGEGSSLRKSLSIAMGYG